MTDRSQVLVGACTTSIDLLGVDTVLGVQVLNLSGGEDSVELVVDLELSAKLHTKS